MDGTPNGKAVTVTTPEQPAPTPTTARASGITVPITLRGVISIAETAAYVVATILAVMNNGSDFRNAAITVFAGLIAHGVNHNAGGSPV